MLKCHQKRAFDFMSAEAPSQAAMSADWMGSDLGAQAGPRFQINPAAMASPANKRYRGGAVGAMDIAGEGAGAGAEDLVARGGDRLDVDEAHDGFLGKAPAGPAGFALQAAAAPQAVFNNPQTGERLYSLSEVKEIVKKATSEKERSLKEEYERVLRNKLDEQFQQFSTFNEDFLSRQMASSSHDYMS